MYRLCWPTVLCILLLPRVAAAWGPLLHEDVNRAAAMAAPDEMAGWRAYADLLARHSNDADYWKISDAAELSRHYIDLETFGYPTHKELPREQPEQEIPARRRPAGRGTAPWSIVAVQEQLTEAMREGDWREATRIAAALGHYVADTHQPLHCTRNHNGQLTGNDGVHTRWEVHMPARHWRAEFLDTIEPRHVPDPWSAVCAWIGVSYAKHEDVLAADDEALAAAGGDVESERYYRVLWEESGELFRVQANAAAADLANFYFTAWVDAGRPSIPAPPPRIRGTTIHLTPEARKAETRKERSTLVLVVILAAVSAFVLARSIRLTADKRRQTGLRS